MRLLPRDVRIVGCTATPERADGTPLGDIFQALVTTASYSTLLAGGWLAPARVVPTIGMDPAAAYLAHGQRRPGILFAPTIAECRTAVATLRARGVRAACLDSSVPDGVRAALVAAYDAGGIDLLASPFALAEGFDSPRASVCVLARTCVHSGTYLQIANRVTRPHVSKTAASPALLLDCTGAAERHGHPTEDRVYSLAGGAGSGIRRAPAVARAASVAPRLEDTTALPRAAARPSGVVARVRSVRLPPLPRTPHAVGRTLGSVLRSWWLRVA
jgi:superfamily II DNA or RNA helicase